MSDATETHLALESVGRALRHMSDGFLSVGTDWRIEFVNEAAERLLAFPEGLVGRSLWEVPAVRDLPGFEERCRGAMATEKPGGLEMRWPGTDRWYNLRLLPVAGSLTIYITDATEKRLREAEREASASRAALAAQVTRRLSEAVSAQDVVTAVADSLLPAFGAAGLIILTLEDDRLNVVGSAGYPPHFRDRVHGMPVHADAPVSRVLRVRTPQFVASAQEYTDRFPGSADIQALSGMAAWAFLPLIVSGRTIGCAVISFDQPRRFTEDERTMLTALSGQIAQAVERASLYDEATTRARELQRGLLPRALPSLPAVTSAARFLPAGAGTEVGGDWYDILRLSADRVALVVGDVMGHGMSEAATMGRLRTAVRTLSDLELPPDEILAHLNDLVTDLGEDYFATCLYGVYDPITGDFTYASAGHPPPALVHPDGTVTYLAYRTQPPARRGHAPVQHVDDRPARRVAPGPLHRWSRRITRPRHRPGHGTPRPHPPRLSRPTIWKPCATPSPVPFCRRTGPSPTTPPSSSPEPSASRCGTSLCGPSPMTHAPPARPATISVPSFGPGTSTSWSRPPNSSPASWSAMSSATPRGL